MGKQKEGIFLGQKGILTSNIFVNLELGLQFLVQEEAKGRGNFDLE